MRFLFSIFIFIAILFACATKERATTQVDSKQPCEDTMKKLENPNK